MGQVTSNACETVSSELPDVHAPPSNDDDSRTLVWQCVLNLVLPVFALVSMSVLTIVTIVLLVTTVADAGWHLGPSDVSLDPWSGW
jgi:hypothetical protein